MVFKTEAYNSDCFEFKLFYAINKNTVRNAENTLYYH